jgi:hypothetical protein
LVEEPEGRKQFRMSCRLRGFTPGYLKAGKLAEVRK